MAKPNFLIIGDLKAGSTSLYSYLRQHPQVFMPGGRKELRYFSFDSENPYHVRAKSSVVRTLDEYLAYFEESGNARAIGEASPNYLRSPGAARRIKQQVPDIRLIVCLRDPAERLHSLHQMHYRSGSTRQAFDEHLFSQDAVWIKGNFYWSELNRYFQIFDRNQINVVLFDDLKASAARVVRNLYEFLGVDPSFLPDLKPRNTGGIPRNVFIYSLLVRGKNSLKRLGAPPAHLRKLWAEIRKESLQREELDPTIRRKILEVCEDDIRRTQDLIQRDLSKWLERDPS
jgi:Sulfotransferase family